VAKKLLEPSLTSEVDDGNAPIGLKVLLEVGKVRHPLFEVMIGIAGENEVDAVVRQAGVVRARQYDFDVLVSFVLYSLGEVGIHLRIDIHGVYVSGGPHGIRQSKRKIATSRPEVCDLVSCLDLQGLNDFLWVLPFIAVKPFVGPSFDVCAGCDPYEEYERET